jgi:hypothetical protein
MRNKRDITAFGCVADDTVRFSGLAGRVAKNGFDGTGLLPSLGKDRSPAWERVASQLRKGSLPSLGKGRSPA